MSNEFLSGSEAQEFLSVAEAANKLRVSEKTIRRRIKDGGLVAHQFGGKNKKLFIPVEAIDAPNNFDAPTATKPPTNDIHRPRCLGG